jgi:tellurite methyltransferase
MVKNPPFYKKSHDQGFIMDVKNKKLNQDYWDGFYKSNAVSIPSQFCVYVATDIPKPSTIVEFGSGNGRDSLYFASQGFEVVAIDLSHEAIQLCSETALSRSIEHASFYCGDISSEDDIRNAIERARGQKNTSLVIYSRFVMHTLDDQQQADFLSHLAKHLQKGDKIYFEFRSSEDACLSKHFGGHYRRYVNADDFCSTLVEKNGLVIDYCIVGQGMAKFKEEDPFVSRIVARK